MKTAARVAVVVAVAGSWAATATEAGAAAVAAVVERGIDAAVARNTARMAESTAMRRKDGGDGGGGEQAAPAAAVAAEAGWTTRHPHGRRWQRWQQPLQSWPALAADAVVTANWLGV